MNRTVCYAIAAILSLLAASRVIHAADDAAAAESILVKALKDADRCGLYLDTLRGISDKELIPLFQAGCRSASKECRLYCLLALAELAEKDAAPILHEMLKKDPEMPIRAEALARLLKLKQISPDQMVEALRTQDQIVQFIAARGLATGGSDTLAKTPLRVLTESDNPVIAAQARLAMLGLGDAGYLTPLRAAVHDPQTSPDVIAALLAQIAEDRIAPAAELAETIAQDATWPLPARLQAYRALAAASTDGPGKVVKAILAASNMVLAVQILSCLSDAPNARAALAELAKRTDAVGILARLELWRGGDDLDGGKIAGEAVATGHPVAIDYVLELARRDVQAKNAKAPRYTPALLACIANVPNSAVEVGDEHLRGAVAATILADLGDKPAMDGLAEFLRGRYGGPLRAVVVGLLRTKNKQACDLVRPLLKSPYWPVESGAALTLGRFGDADARPTLRGIIAAPDKNNERIVCLACWFYLKTEGGATATSPASASQGTSALQRLAEALQPAEPAK